MGKYHLKAKTLLLIDALGALVTGISLLLIKFIFNAWFAMPANILLILAGIAFVFFLFSFSAFYLVKTRHVKFLKAISCANLFYCLLIIALLINDGEQLKLFDWIYFTAEVVVILALVFVERKSITQNNL